MCCFLFFDSDLNCSISQTIRRRPVPVRIFINSICSGADSVPRWIGRGGDSTPCNPVCQPGEQALTTQTCESGGSQAFCCSSDLRVKDWCTFYGKYCGSCRPTILMRHIRIPECTDILSMTCRPDPPQRLLTWGIKGELDMDLVEFCQDVNVNCPSTCTNSQVKAFCCVEDAPFSELTCEWHGTPPLCQCEILYLSIFI